MTSVGSNLNIFCVDVHMELTPPSPVRMRPPEPGLPSPPCGRHKWMAPITRTEGFKGWRNQFKCCKNMGDTSLHPKYPRSQPAQMQHQLLLNSDKTMTCNNCNQILIKRNLDLERGALYLGQYLHWHKQGFRRL